MVSTTIIYYSYLLCKLYRLHEYQIFAYIARFLSEVSHTSLGCWIFLIPFTEWELFTLHLVVKFGFCVVFEWIFVAQDPVGLRLHVRLQLSKRAAAENLQ